MKRLAISPVIASIILSAMVLVIGGSVWTYSKSAASAIASDYTNDTVEMINTIQERFTIEHVCFDNDTHILSLWIYNYGDVIIRANTTITIDDTDFKNNSIKINSLETKKVTFDIGTTLPTNEDITIYVLTLRGNNKRETYYIR